MSDSNSHDHEAEKVRLGKLLREAREYAGLSQEEAAARVAIPRTGIGNIEAGRRRVDAIELQRLADLYRRPVSFFTGGAGAEPSDEQPEYVARLAAQAKQLSPDDRQELSQFADFLASRAKSAPKRH